MTVFESSASEKQLLIFNWNSGEVVANSIKLGTTAANINKNAIMLRRVRTGTSGDMASMPESPASLTVQ